MGLPPSESPSPPRVSRQRIGEGSWRQKEGTPPPLLPLGCVVRISPLCGGGIGCHWAAGRPLSLLPSHLGGPPWPGSRQGGTGKTPERVLRPRRHTNALAPGHAWGQEKTPLTSVQLRVRLVSLFLHGASPKDMDRHPLTRACWLGHHQVPPWPASREQHRFTGTTTRDDSGLGGLSDSFHAGAGSSSFTSPPSSLSQIKSSYICPVISPTPRNPASLFRHPRRPTREVGSKRFSPVARTVPRGPRAHSTWPAPCYASPCPIFCFSALRVPSAQEQNK